MTSQEGPKTASKSTKIEVKKRSKKEARSKRAIVHFWGRPGGMRGPTEGIWEGEEGSWAKIWSKKWIDLQKWTIELGDLGLLNLTRRCQTPSGGAGSKCLADNPAIGPAMMVAGLLGCECG